MSSRRWSRRILAACLVIGGPAAQARATRPGRLTVLDPDGRPAAGATVVATPPRARLFMFDGDVTPPSYPPATVVRTGGDGTVAVVTVPADSRGVVAFAAAGYAEVDPAVATGGGTVRLQPWAHVVGRLLIGREPGAHRSVMVSLGGRRYAEDRFRMASFVRATTDADGQFRLDRVLPGEVSVSRFVGDGRGGGMGTEGVELTLRPDQTATVTIGGAGRPVVGRVELPTLLAGRPGLFLTGQLYHVEPPPPKPIPADVLTGPVAGRRAWMRTFLQTDAGRAWQAQVDRAVYGSRSYPLELSPDGTFRVEDVAADGYRFDVSAYDPAGVEVAKAEGDLSVPPMPGGGSDDPLAAGTLRLQPARLGSGKSLAVGDVAPDFTLPTLDGGTVRLSDLRGRLVLLDDWSIRCTPCVERMLALKDVRAAYGREGQVAIVGLDADDDPHRSSVLVRRQHVDWPQAWAHGDAGRRVLANYQSDGSGVWLIGSDGKVLGKDLDGPGVAAAVGQALARQVMPSAACRP